MNDRQLDNLIRENFEREAMLEDINRRVMHQISRQERRITSRKFLRMVAVAFGTPLILLGYGITIYKYVMEQPQSTLVQTILIASVMIVLVSFAKIILKFSARNL